MSRAPDSFDVLQWAREALMEERDIMVAGQVARIVHIDQQIDDRGALTIRLEIRPLRTK